MALFKTTDETPTGSLILFCGNTAPNGYLSCDGSEISQSTYANLYNIIGTNFNTGGESAGNFRLPDFRGRNPIGVGQGSGLTNRTLADNGGAETHQLSEAELPSHNHSVKMQAWEGRGTLGIDPDNKILAKTAVGTEIYTSGSETPNLYFQDSAIEQQNVGSGNTHNNMSPFLCVHFVIKY